MQEPHDASEHTPVRPGSRTRYRHVENVASTSLTSASGFGPTMYHSLRVETRRGIET